METVKKVDGFRDDRCRMLDQMHTFDSVCAILPSANIRPMRTRQNQQTCRVLKTNDTQLTSSILHATRLMLAPYHVIQGYHNSFMPEAISYASITLLSQEFPFKTNTRKFPPFLPGLPTAKSFHEIQRPFTIPFNS